jgi:hypothetical protein
MALVEYKRPNISLTELYDMRKKKDINRTKSFDHIMELCHRRIRNIASYGGMNCFYEIPGILIGFPLYNLAECTQYIIDKIRSSGFLVQLLPPPQISVIYISWDPQEIKPKRPVLTGPSGKMNKLSITMDNNNPHNPHNPHNPRTLNTRGIVQETKIITADNHVKPSRITNPLKDRFRIF